MAIGKDVDLSKYQGKWVALLGKRVVASGKTLKDIERYVKRKASDKTPPTKIPAAFKVPRKGEGPYVLDGLSLSEK